ncbi:energy transducer TonB [Bacteroides sp. 224]|uniref:energy transducer TonB n=1 Tax=Bacteroides sp. 224 TaxID=2302936 RepID=UPI0013D474B0|nr:energy transducer TonB [Bacteroides sp. 224]NDV65383.1 energy transducer TonB [Bacteroides sp. 224]
MKKLFYHKVYNILLFLSNRFSNRQILKYKVLVGSALLAMTSSCQSPKNSSKENQPTASTDSIQEEQNPDDVEILCYEPAVIRIDSLEEEEPTATCYVMLPEPEPEIEPEETDFIMCYDISVDDLEPDTIQEDPNRIYEIVEQMPEFPGGLDSLMHYIRKNLKYPCFTGDYAIEGRVIVRIVVEKDGTISSPQILRSVDEFLDKEALRLIREMPKWKPGQHNGKTVRANYVIPFMFKRLE